MVLIMIIYFIPILLCLVSACSRELSDNKRWTLLMGIALCLFLCFGYMTGSDWRPYEFWYENLDFNRFYYGYTNEPGYYLLMWLMKKLHVPFWVFFTLTKTALFILVYKTIFDLCRESGWITLIYYLPSFGVYLFIDNPMRNCIAIGLFMISVKYIIEQRFWPFFFLSLLAATFHLSALFVIPFYPLYQKEVKKSVYVILYIIFNLVFWNRDLIIEMISLVAGLLPYMESKFVSYFLYDSAYAQGETFSLMLIWQTALFVLLICYKERIVEKLGKYGLFAFNSAMIYFLLVRFNTSIQVIMRLQLYYSVYVSVCVGLLVLSFEWRSRLMYLGVLFMVSMYIYVDRLTGTDIYVPYSNIVEYAAKGEFPSYAARYHYNIKNSPYKSSSTE